MNTKTKFAIGCLVQWYECEMIGEYVKSLNNAIKNYDGEVVVDFTVITNEDLEKCTTPEQKTICIDKINKELEAFNNIRTIDKLYSIADYRREFNTNYCDDVDVLVWGESDMLLPSLMFTILDMLHKNVCQKTPKYLSFFGTCKMWDDSWKLLEHPKFTNQKHCGDPNVVGSTWHTMSQEEMDNINNETSELDIVTLPEHKFNGCGLIISSEVIRSGANIPKSVFFIHEDTAFMLVTNKLLGNIPQYVVKNILLTHNRKHPKKRMYVLGEKETENLNEKKENHAWYKRAADLSQLNCYNIFNPNYSSYNWKDVFTDIK